MQIINENIMVESIKIKNTPVKMYEELTPYYKNSPNNLVFKLFEANHVENFEMVEEMIKFFDDNL